MALSGKPAKALRIVAVLALCFAMVCTIAGCSQPKAAEKSDSATTTEQATTRTFTDSAGRQVEVPTEITAIVPSGHTANQVLLTIAPDKMVGVSQELSADQLKYIKCDQDLSKLPVLGAAFGAKGDLNKESVAATGAQILIDTGEYKDGIAADLDDLQNQLGIPCVFIETKMDDYGAAYTMLGDLLGMQERGKELSDYCSAAYKETTDVMAKVGDNRVTVAYMMGDDGTNTIAKNSFQGQVVDLVATNVADLGEVSGSGQGVETSLEQLALWNPEIILFQTGSIYDTVGDDAAWSQLSAIGSKKYYQVPNSPWCWLNSPPTVNQVLGMQWLSRLLYPDQYGDDMYQTVADYYKTFYGYDLSQAEFDQITAGALPAKA